MPSTNSISIIVPTLWACPSFAAYAQRLAAVAAVREIIVVDNNHAAAVSLVHPKIKVLVQDGNIFVNPAWNLGAEMAQGDMLCFLNDDLAAKLEVFAFGSELLSGSDNVGLVGLKWDKQLGELSFVDLVDRDSPAFGCLMMMRRTDFNRIPSCLKIWHGDDYLVTLAKMRGRQVVGLSGFAHEQQSRSVGTNSIRKDIEALLERDSVIWNRYVRRWLLLRHKPLQALRSAVLRFAAALG
jgi:glycosyltransferase involved in cell wall biosynthesis